MAVMWCAPPCFVADYICLLTNQQAHTLIPARIFLLFTSLPPRRLSVRSRPATRIQHTPTKQMAYAYTLDRSQLAWGVSKKEENAMLEREVREVRLVLRVDPPDNRLRPSTSSPCTSTPPLPNIPPSRKSSSQARWSSGIGLTIWRRRHQPRRCVHTRILAPSLLTMTQEQSPQEPTDVPEEVPVPVESQSAVVEMWPPNDIFEDDETYLFSTFPTFEACHVRTLSRT